MPVIEQPILPDPTLINIKLLCEQSEPYQLLENSNSLFVEAMKENISWHKKRNPFYERYLEIKKFDIKNLKTVLDCANIPFLPAIFFKTHETVSVDKSRIILNLTSSGTSGQKSQMFFDDWSIHSPQRMVEFIFNYYGWSTPTQKCNYILFSYETNAGAHLGTSFTDHYLCRFAPVNEAFTALKLTGDGGYEFDLFGTVDKLREFEKQGLPVRIFGFPAFLNETIQRMKDLKLSPLKLPKDSLIFLGGGWKSKKGQAIPSEELYHRASEMFGFSESRMRDGYGSVEHCIPYVECENHNLHIPVWSRVFIRNVVNLELLNFGEEGFIHFVSPYITSVPAQSVLMDDLAILFKGSDCDCTAETPFFKITGRAGSSKNKSCAISAAELLRGSSL